jgi:hypothetical protein
MGGLAPSRHLAHLIGQLIALAGSGKRVYTAAPTADVIIRLLPDKTPIARLSVNLLNDVPLRHRVARQEIPNAGKGATAAKHA